MKVKLSQAVKMFFSTSSLEMVYFEAVANSLDAAANIINIEISADALNRPETLKIVISDNGEGLTDERYSKFSKLFDVEEGSHKGLGRLVYLCYFENVSVKSNFSSVNERTFVFSEAFEENTNICSVVYPQDSGTTFEMSGYILQKIAKSEYINAEFIKKRILEEFYTQLFILKKSNINVKINVKSTIGKSVIENTVNNFELPDLTHVELEVSVNLIDRFQLYYSIEKTEKLEQTSIIAAISVDNRTYNFDIIAPENFPQGYKMVFLFLSEFFIGKVDATRQNLTLSKTEIKSLQHIFRKKVVSLIEESIPSIKKSNHIVRKNLLNQYPHLSGYFDSDNIGYLKKSDIIKSAQEIFFNEQKELLEAHNLTDEQFEKALNISARSLTEYILFRQLTINKLRETTSSTSESDLHKIFATMRSDGKFDKTNKLNDLYKNNCWLLDDKYMTYETVLSDRELTDLIAFITENETTTRDDDRIDIALVFSSDPNGNIPFDVVIVELKKRGLPVEDNQKTISQLEKRARKLMKYYKNKIQRIWYYGIIEFNEDIELALAGEYKELYSNGKMYYKETQVAISLDPKITLPIGVYMWDINAIVEDANSRNNTFLSFIKSKFISES